MLSGYAGSFCCGVAAGGAAPGNGDGKVQPSWAGAPSLQSSTLLIPGTPALGFRESSLHGHQDSRGARMGLKTMPARRTCLLLTALQHPHNSRFSSSTLPCMIPSPRETPETQHKILISGGKFAQCFGCFLEPSLPWVTAVCTKLEQTAFAGEAETQPARKCFLGY